MTDAGKFTERGRPTVAGRRRNGAVEVAIRDTGVGIAPAALPHVFAFRQADASTTRRFGGSGLGLAIGRRLVALDGGAIAAASEPDRGSTFTVALPAATPARPAP